VHHYHKVVPTLLLSLHLLFSANAAAQEVYTYGAASRDGIGKFYLGREISHVMGHLGAGWLERPTREQEERTDLLLAALQLEPGETVADIGAGTGYFTFPLAGIVGEGGRVLAVDIQPEMLALITQRMETDNQPNIEPILATETDPGLPPGAVDLALLVDAYHEFSHPREVMNGVVQALSARGRVVLVEYRGEDPAVPIKPLHKMTVAQAEREMRAVGLTLEKVDDSLPRQHILTFRSTDSVTLP
jgi:SAM-dependent methyltransferase